MEKEDNYVAINKKSWNNRTDVHFQSDFYNNEQFIQGKSSLNSIELELLGDVKGKSILHLQCHFGQDTISLNRMGAEVVGVDLSDRSIERANELNDLTKTNANFICCNVYDLPNHLDRQFDIVYTSYGTITWLPDLNKWAEIISRFLKPKGQFIFVEFHPVVWMFDDDFSKIQYPYLNHGPIAESEEGTYADKNASIQQDYVTWNHGLSEVTNSIISHGLEINLLNEMDYSPYNCFSQTIEVAPGKFRIKHLDNKLPMVYAIKATKK